ncbi:pseudouridine synthase [Reichenbachiella carrageenanivorans]|uniref:Pseudouridine synthase n=1 Tax=Reichenbachiella carrageenanivorans TaxID=2979869 RepID=A0ABY6CYI8_9BACT|nr:pseudouridine synthase [Reichenbachiella carrageenanivorans]UXX78985.1 pseudouridine synthase [Reichenbachiella carrageenanivorans]
MSEPSTIANSCFTDFESPIEGMALPERFTYPFFYEPHPLCLLAAEQLQARLNTQTDWRHDFGIDHFVEGVNIGKMFGVLLVRRADGRIGFLSAFSGKLAEQHHWPGFVPPVVDYLAVDSFFRQGEKRIEAVTAEIQACEQSAAYVQAQQDLAKAQSLSEAEIAACKATEKQAKKNRKAQRAAAEKTATAEEYAALEAQLKRESMALHYQSKDLNRSWKQKLAVYTETFQEWEQKLKALKEKRRQLSNDLQQEIFDQYQFLNIAGETRSVCHIFEQTVFKTPPSGAGDCAAPKLLQYAFRHGLQPLAMAEFWWGQSPSSEIRKHGYFYPSCKGKCEPILSHMLAGMEVDESPMLSVNTEEKKLPVVYEDDFLLVVNKPHEFLSVPGKSNADSVWARMARIYPEATGPLLVHRLDRATSGLLLVAKTKDVHKALQEQFLDRSIKKRYVALLEGEIAEEEGVIELPLRPDIEDRPRQLVCNTHGKSAVTRWQVVERSAGRTLVHLWPMTGRTHQLRVHAAHQDGLNTPMVGDDLYGKPATRLYLQAAALTFVHPISKQEMSFELPSDF